eukprot:scaffold27498_cov36-Phaeocystis_antarctica.AAC.1
MASATWLSSSGRVWWRRKAQWILQCPMDFRWMPFDEQLPARTGTLRPNLDPDPDQVHLRQYPIPNPNPNPEQLKITFGSPDSDGKLSKSLAVIDDECRVQNSEWTVLDMDHFETTEVGDELEP